MSGSNGIYAFKSKAWIYWLFGGLWLLGFWLSGESATAATLAIEVAPKLS